MASEILGLFSGQSPQELRNAYLDSMMVSPAQMGSQGLLQQVVSMGRNAGAVLGTGAGQLLGGKVAGEVEAAYLDDAIKSASAIKGTPAQKMKAVADFLADKPGMGAQYLKAMEEAKKLELSDLQAAEAKFKSENRTREMKETRMVMNPLTQQKEPKTFYWTEKWENGRWVQATMPSTTTPAGEEEKPTAAAESPQAKAAAERKRRQESGAYTNPVKPNAPQKTTPIPPQGYGAMDYGFEGGGLINPEGF